MIALLTACLFFEILVHMLNIASAKVHAKTVFGHLKQVHCNVHSMKIKSNSFESKLLYIKC